MQRIIPNLRDRKIALPSLQIHIPPTKPTRHTRPLLKLTMEAQRIPHPSAHIPRPKIIALNLRSFGDVGHGRNAVAGVGEVAAGFLCDAVLRVGVLLPEIFDLGAGCEAAAGGGFGAGAVGGEVDVCGGAAKELRHGFVVSCSVVEEDGNALGGFHHHYIGNIHGQSRTV